MQILVEDDQMENQYMLETLLKGNGHQVLTAGNGSQALDIIKADRIDMIITDDSHTGQGNRGPQGS